MVWSGGVYCISFSSEMQFTALTVMKGFGDSFPPLFSAQELANQCFRFLPTLLLYSASVSDMSGLYRSSQRKLLLRQDSSPRTLADVALFARSGQDHRGTISFSTGSLDVLRSRCLGRL